MSHRNLDVTASEAGPISVNEAYSANCNGAEVHCLRFEVGDRKAAEIIIKRFPDRNVLSIDNIFVEKRYRQRGYGSRILSMIEEHASEDGVERIEITPFSLDPGHMDDERLRAWYAKRGFIKTGIKMYKPLKELA